VRDRKNGNPGTLVLTSSDLDDYVHVAITVQQPLNLVDLRGGRAIAMGLSTNALRAQSHQQGQRASLALYQHVDRPDGIWYQSRLNGEENIAVYDRSIRNLAAGPRRKLGICPELAPILANYRIVII